jgi:hypothetical protein
MRLTKQATSARITIPRILIQAMVPPHSSTPIRDKSPVKNEGKYVSYSTKRSYTGTVNGCIRTQWQEWKIYPHMADLTQVHPQMRLEARGIKSANTTNCAKNRNQSNKMNDNRVGAKRLVGRESTKRLRSDPRCFYLIYILVLNNLRIQMTIAKKFIPKNTTATILNNAECE